LPISASERGAPPAASARARALIDDDPAAALSLADLAHASGLSRFQVLRAFARATGLTPHAYQLQRRIGLARRLIAGGAALSEAAAASCFADQSHMTRVVVRQYGITPGIYAGARCGACTRVQDARAARMLSRALHQCQDLARH